MFQLIQELSVAGRDINEDGYWLGKNDVVFLDGASSLGSKNHDAVEFVSAFIESYITVAANEAPLHHCVNVALDAIRERFDKKNYDTRIAPSASAIVARSSDHGVDLVLIGDCTAIAYDSCGLARRLYCSEVQRFDNKALALARTLCEQSGVSMAEAIGTATVQECLMSNRKMMNAEDGYRILASNMKPLEESDLIHFDKSEASHILFHSDGFDAVEDDFLNPPFDISASFDRLHALQEADSSLESMPRFKVHDDATALFVRVI